MAASHVYQHHLAIAVMVFDTYLLIVLILNETFVYWIVGQQCDAWNRAQGHVSTFR